MALFRASRERAGPDPHLDRKIALFLAGASLGVAGMATHRRWLVVLGIVLLAAGWLLRFLPGSPRSGDSGER